MKIDKLHNNPSIGSKAPLKANRLKDTSFKEILDSTMTKAIESNLDNIFQDAAEKYGLPSQLLKAGILLQQRGNLFLIY